MGTVWHPLDALGGVVSHKNPRAAVLVPLYEDGDRLRVILTKRPDDMRTHAGDVVFPGGVIDNDEGPVAAAVREAEEEIGLPPENVQVLGGLSVVAPRDPTMVIVPVVARVERPDELVPEPGEVAAIIEPTLDELLDESRWKTRWWGPRRLWFYEFEEGTLWGATAFMMRELLGYFR